MKTKRVKSLAHNRKGISPNHRQHGHVTEKNHKFKTYFRLLKRLKIHRIESYEERFDV